MRLPPQRETRPDSLALGAQQIHVPNKTRKDLDFLDGTPESPQEHPHKSRMTMISPKEREIFHCIPNQHEMSPESPHWIYSHLPFPIIQDRWLLLL